MLNRRHKPTTSTRRKAPVSSPADDPNKSEASFQAQLLHTARCNGWRIDVSDLSKYERDPRFFGHLEAIAPKGRVRSFLEYLWDRKDCIFTFGYHTHDSRRSQAGYFDVTLIHPRRRRLILAELKRDGEYPTIPQRLWYAAAKCLEDAAPGVVLVRIWRPKDWPEIVRELGGVDPYGSRTLGPS